MLVIFKTLSWFKSMPQYIKQKVKIYLHCGVFSSLFRSTLSLCHSTIFLGLALVIYYTAQRFP